MRFTSHAPPPCQELHAYVKIGNRTRLATSWLFAIGCGPVDMHLKNRLAEGGGAVVCIIDDNYSMYIIINQPAIFAGGAACSIQMLHQ